MKRGPRIAIHRASVAPQATAPVLRLERDGSDFIVSPPLGAGGICEMCWIRRRAATTDPKTLAPCRDAGEGLADAFERTTRTPGRPSGRAQRAALARVLRSRVVETRERTQPSMPTRLARVDVAGAVRHETVLPMPDCDRCRLDVARVVQRSLDHLLGRAAGVVCDLREVPACSGEPAFPHVVVVARANSWLSSNWIFGTGASGKGATPEDAIGSAVGEALERYSATVILRQPRIACLSEAEGAIAPWRLTGLAHSQTREGALDNEAKLAWIEARAIRPDGVTRWVPASAAYLRWPEAWGPRPTPPTSNGLAAAPDLASAIDRAFAEVMERHLFFLVWYGVRDAEQPDARALLDPTICKLFEAAALDVRAIVLGRIAGVVAAAACCWLSTPSPRRPRFVLGIGTGRDPSDAVRSAFLELGQVYRGLTWALTDASLEHRARLLASGTVAIEEPFDHGLLYAMRSPEAVPWPFGSAPRRSRPVYFAPEGDPDACFVDLTPPDVAAATGWSVVRVLAPDLIPYHVGSAAFPGALLRFPDGGSPPEFDAHPLS